MFLVIYQDRPQDRRRLASPLASVIVTAYHILPLAVAIFLPGVTHLYT